MNEEKQEYVLNNKCPSCGSSINFDPKTGGWTCTYCRKSFNLDEMMLHDNASNKQNNENVESKNIVAYKCKSCGAEIVTDENTASTFCVYCRNTAILKNKLTGEFRPKMVIPFKNTKEDAINAFKSILKGKPLAPRDFNSAENIEKIRGVYIPFWLFDINSQGKMTCKCTKVRNWYSGNYYYTETKTYDVEREGSLRFEKLPVDGSTHFDNALMNSIEPFDYTQLTDYNHAYLAGFLAEKYDVNSFDASPDAIERCKGTASQELLNSLSAYTSKRIISQNIEVKKDNDIYVLLPVWLLNIKYRNKMYTFAMNGQTGKFIGDIPVDKKRAWMYRIGVFVICSLIIFLISYLIYLEGAL